MVKDPCDRPNGQPHEGPWVSDTPGGPLYCQSCGMWQEDDTNTNTNRSK